MLRYIISFCLVAFSAFGSEEDYDELFPSTPEQLGSLSLESNHLIGGVISPLSGQLVLRQIDLVVKGAEPISLARVYIPPYIPHNFERVGLLEKRHLYQYLRAYKGWQFFSHTRLQYYSESKQYRVSDPNGATLDFYLEGSETKLASPSYAISNASDDKPSGKYDLRNTSIQSLEEGKWLIVTSPEGIKRFYLDKGRTGSSQLYLLFKEVLLNGKILRYHYDISNCLIRVESMDPTEQNIYATLNISGTPKGGNCHFEASTGVTVDYNYQIRRIKDEFKEIENGKKIKKG